MSLVPEFILQNTIVRGIKRMRNDSALIDQLFRNLDQKSTHQIRTFIKQHAIDLAINYPRTTLKVPAIVIVLKSERESHAFLGDSMGLDYPDEFSYDGGVDGELLGGVATVSTINGNPKVVYGPVMACTGTENTIRAEDANWVTDVYLVKTHNVRIVHGTGVGQIRKISGNSTDVLMVSPDWSVVPDDTSVFEIITPPDDLIGEPASLYDRRNATMTLERRGGLYDLSYQIQVIGPNPELTIYLSIILKSIFTLYRTFMEGQGLIDLKMSMSDFSPRPDYLPDLAYMRTLNIDFTFPFDIFENLDGIADNFHLTLEGQPDGSIVVPPVLIDEVWEYDAKGNIVGCASDVQRVYFGVATPPVSYDAIFVQNTVGSQGSAITSKRQKYINYTSGPGQKMYYCIPASFGGIPANFIDAGTNIEAGFVIAATISITTNFGTEPYNIWESEQAGLGFVQLKVT